MAVTTTTQIDPGKEFYFVERMLRTGRPFLLHDKFGRKLSFRSRNGMKIKLREYDDLAIADAPVAEGVTGASVQQTKTDFEATLQQYHNWVEITDVAEVVNVESVRTEVSMKLGINMNETIDAIYRDTLNGSSNAYRAAGVATRVLVNSIILLNDLKRIDRTMFANKARYITATTEGSQNANTTPIRPAYFVLTHGDMKYDIETLAGYDSVETYASQGKVYDSEIGRVGNFRFVLSQQAKVFPNEGAAVGAGTYISTGGANNDVYTSLIFGQDAYAYCPLDELTVQNIVKGFDSGGPENPVNNIMSIAWKAMTCLVVYHPLNMTRYESCATA
jgi:N4-gp56 family major capsid protein